MASIKEEGTMYCFTTDSKHVDKWVRQFSEESQEVILAETFHGYRNTLADCATNLVILHFSARFF